VDWTVRELNPAGGGGEIFQACCKIGTASLSRGESGWSVRLTTHPHIAPRLKKEKNYTSAPFLGLYGLF